MPYGQASESEHGLQQPSRVVSSSSANLRKVGLFARHCDDMGQTSGTSVPTTACFVAFSVEGIVETSTNQSPTRNIPLDGLHRLHLGGGGGGGGAADIMYVLLRTLCEWTQVAVWIGHRWRKGLSLFAERDGKVHLCISRPFLRCYFQGTRPSVHF